MVSKLEPEMEPIKSLFKECLQTKSPEISQEVRFKSLFRVTLTRRPLHKSP